MPSKRKIKISSVKRELKANELMVKFFQPYGTDVTDRQMSFVFSEEELKKNHKFTKPLGITSLLLIGLGFFTSYHPVAYMGFIVIVIQMILFNQPNKKFLKNKIMENDKYLIKAFNKYLIFFFERKNKRKISFSDYELK